MGDLSSGSFLSENDLDVVFSSESFSGLKNRLAINPLPPYFAFFASVIASLRKTFSTTDNTEANTWLVVKGTNVLHLMVGTSLKQLMDDDSTPVQTPQCKHPSVNTPV